MQDEIQNESQNESKKSSREMWLFLIFLDLIATCVFGFFIYKSFFGLPHENGTPSKSAEPFLEDVLVEDIKTDPQEVVLTPSAPATQPAAVQEQPAVVSAPVQEEVKQEAPAPVAEVKKDEPKKEEVKKEEPTKADVKADAKKAEAKKADAKKEDAQKNQPKKKSVFISGSGKTRKVTFKYYGNGKKVAVVGGFTMSKPQALKKSGKEWSTSVVVFPGTYKYMFVVDGKTMLDPNGRIADGKSVFTAK